MVDSQNGPLLQGRVTVVSNPPTFQYLCECSEASTCCGSAIAIGIKESGIAGPEFILHNHMAIASDYRDDGMPRVRVLCALTGELIYEPTHPWLEQVKCHLLKKWTWSNKGEFLPTALTMFHLHFEANQQPVMTSSVLVL